MKNITTYLGCIVMVLFVVYITTNMLSLNNKIVEGLTSSSSSSKTPEELITLLKTTKQKLVDDLHIDKYKSQYHEMLLNAEDVLHLQILEQLKSAIGNDKLSNEKTLILLSQLQNAKTALKDLDEFFEHFKLLMGCIILYLKNAYLLLFHFFQLFHFFWLDMCTFTFHRSCIQCLFFHIW